MKDDVQKDIEGMVTNPPRRNFSAYGKLSAILAMASMGMGGQPGGMRGVHAGELRRPKRFDNSPDRAPGMKPFDIDGVTIYAGTPKAARKLARLLKHQPTT